MIIEKPSCLADYKIVHTQKIVWGDMDSMKHVNNTRYFYYCETARIEFMRLLFPTFGSDTSETMKTGLALAETSCRYKLPVTFPDNLLIGTAVTKIEENQFGLIHLLYSEKMGLVAAEAHARMVHYDFEKGKRLPFDDALMTILVEHQLPLQKNNQKMVDRVYDE